MVEIFRRSRMIGSSAFLSWARRTQRCASSRPESGAERFRALEAAGLEVETLAFDVGRDRRQARGGRSADGISRGDEFQWQIYRFGAGGASPEPAPSFADSVAARASRMNFTRWRSSGQRCHSAQAGQLVGADEPEEVGACGKASAISSAVSMA